MRAWPPVCRRKRRKSQQKYFQEFWDSCTSNKTSEIFKNALSGILGLLCAEQDAGNLKQMHFQEFWDTSEISKIALSGILGLLCAEQDVEISKNVLSGMMVLLGAEQNVGNI